MKKQLITLTLLLLISFTSAWSYEESDSYKGMDVLARISGEEPSCDGIRYGQYCVGDWYSRLDYRGDEFKIFYSQSEWPKVYKSGIRGGEFIYSGKHYFPQKEVPKFIICAYDYESSYDSEGSEQWVWVSKCGGYLGSGNLNFKKIECYKDSDCGDMAICDRTGEWNDWKCIPVECKNEDIKCESSEYYTCKNNKWENQGKIIGKCDVNCLSDSNCGSQIKVNEFCKDGQVNINYRIEKCEENQCIGSKYIEIKEIQKGLCNTSCTKDSECADQRNSSKYTIGERTFYDSITQKCEENICKENIESIFVPDCNANIECLSICGDKMPTCVDQLCKCDNKPTYNKGSENLIKNYFEIFLNWIKQLF